MQKAHAVVYNHLHTNIRRITYHNRSYGMHTVFAASYNTPTVSIHPLPHLLTINVMFEKFTVRQR